MSQNQKIGYARVSTEDQKLDLQKDALIKAGCSIIYEEQKSGKDLERPELKNCLKALREGDTLVVWKLDRLGRSVSDLVKIVEDLAGRGIFFNTLSENIDSSTPIGKLQFHVFSAMAEYERALIRERTKAGLAAAKARGRKGGRKTKLNEKQLREIKALLKDPEITVSDVAEKYGVSRATLYRAINQ